MISRLPADFLKKRININCPLPEVIKIVIVINCNLIRFCNMLLEIFFQSYILDCITHY